jgi:RimJ/RimL family protein N-acetyltransferase
MPEMHTLNTERLSMRWLRPGDEPLLLAVWNDPAFIQNVGDRGVRTTEEASEALGNGPLKLYADYGYGPYRVALIDGDEPIGICGLFKRENLDDPDIGFALLPDYCGRGLAFEAAVAVATHARDGLGLSRMTAIVSPQNSPSIGLIEKLGMHFERLLTMPGDDKEICLFSIDWDRID